MGFPMVQALIDYATFVAFELLPSSRLDGGMLRDMHRVYEPIGLQGYI